MEITINCPELSDLAAAIRDLAAALGRAPVAPAEPEKPKKTAAKAAAAPEPEPEALPDQEPARAYTVDDLAKAATKLVDEGKQQDLIEILKSFGVPSLVKLPPDAFPEFAARIRALGAEL